MAINLPLISVLLPVYNGAATIENAVRSILDQTWTTLELILVDDGSTDQTATIIHKLAASDGRVRILKKEQGGIVSALNFGLAFCTGDFIARMDADDFSHPRRLAAQMEFLIKNPDCGVVSSLVRFGGNTENAAGYAFYVDWINTITTHQQIYLNRFVESPIAHPSVLMRKSTIEIAGIYRDGPFPEDYELWLRMMAAGIRFGKVEEELLIWNDPPGRLSRIHSDYDPQAFYNVKVDYYANWYTDEIRKNRKTGVWGAGRLTRKRADLLKNAGVSFDFYVDINPRIIGNLYKGVPVIYKTELPSPESCFIISMVGSRGAREEIEEILMDHNFEHGRDYQLLA